MQSEIDSLRQQIATLQIELALKEQIQKMQSEIDLLKWRINEITSVDSTEYK
ncbi:13255_t:CDS:2 [Gigaspora margarita]|uniref:13255_t:CDS:1 n=1 Tax=Gigaspora margarita TaxID=4874 RepID=A0ABN7W5Y4_GIGMA|nr:13255_t:CDS:2 [Gigaspora margarita]